MKRVIREDMAVFSVKGQIVIPRHIRHEFEIEAGTRAVVTGTPDGILIKPVTAKSCRCDGMCDVQLLIRSSTFMPGWRNLV